MDKIIEELNLSRNQIESDRNAIVAIRSKLNDVEGKEKAIKDQLKKVLKRIPELNSQIAERNVDLTFIKTKDTVSDESLEQYRKRKNDLEKKLAQRRKEYFGLIRKNLKLSTDFAFKWSCSCMGELFRQSERAFKEKELKNICSQLKLELSDFFEQKELIQKAKLEREKLFAGLKYREEALENEEIELCVKIAEVSDVLQKLERERQQKQQQQIQQQIHQQSQQIQQQIHQQPQQIQQQKQIQQIFQPPKQILQQKQQQIFQPPKQILQQKQQQIFQPPKQVQQQPQHQQIQQQAQPQPQPTYQQQIQHKQPQQIHSNQSQHIHQQQLKQLQHILQQEDSISGAFNSKKFVFKKK